MKKLSLIIGVILMVTSSAFATDLSRFAGKWVCEEDGQKKGNITITYDKEKDILAVPLGTIEDEPFIIQNKGQIVVGGAVLRFTSESYDDDDLLISAIFDSTEGIPLQMLSSLKLVESDNKLRVQFTAVEYSTTKGLESQVDTQFCTREKENKDNK
ncbi:MAG: hypothetical protein HYS98_00555 [Deltaproteobacteria bacterium]|nr:hypothetical protein [Deltaproteobacteria bacterium]